MSAYPTAFTLGLELQWSKKDPAELQRAYAARDMGLTLGLMIQSKPEFSDRRDMITRLDRVLLDAQQDTQARQDLQDLNDKLGLGLDLQPLESDEHRFYFLDAARRLL